MPRARGEPPLRRSGGAAAAATPEGPQRAGRAGRGLRAAPLPSGGTAGTAGHGGVTAPPQPGGVTAPPSARRAGLGGRTGRVCLGVCPEPPALPGHRTGTEIQPKMDTEKVQKNQCDMKTDLNLLLECLKYQMDCPLSQKEALITIYSICQQNSEASEYFREIGGLMFINDLAKSSAHGIVKEAALFTLGIIIESNVYCQQTLCTSALFEDLILFLINKDSGVNLKRMSVYVILVLVSNNKNGQTYVRDTGCISLLLQLFRTTLSRCGPDLSDAHTEQRYQLWSSVCSALCACVNNPQNEDNQNICCSVFPDAKEWLESCTEPDIVRPICSFVGLTVANNSYVQKYFVSIGGLDTLAKVLLELMHDSCLSHSGTKLAVVVTKTLDACIANNSAMGVVLAKYHTVAELLKLLGNETLNTGEKISIILTIGHCTEVCEENQCELLQNNGLPLMIQVLTESQDEELIKAATFVLQNCKQMTEQLSLKINDNSLSVSNEEELDVQVRKRSLQDYWKKANEILHRINLIEQEHAEEGVQGGVFVDGSSNPANSEALKSHEVNPAGPKMYLERAHKEDHSPQLTLKLDDQVLAPAVNCPPRKSEAVNTTDAASAGQSNIPRSGNELQTDRALQSHSGNDKTAHVKNQSVPQASEQSFQPPAEPVRNRTQTCTADQNSSCSEITRKHKSASATSSSHKMADLRCSGCAAGGLSFNSQTFTKMLQSCQHRCDHHKVILEAEERYREELRRSALCNSSRHRTHEKIVLAPVRKDRLHTEISTFRSKKDSFQSILLTPSRKTKPNTSNRDEYHKNIWWTGDYNLTPAYEKSFQKTQDANLKRQGVKEMCPQKRQHFPENCIHALDKDEKGRTSVDLSKKYYRLQKQMQKNPKEHQ
ncbi:telomere repeats-binding bouquet formation protein 1 isoform X2 [Neopelma chrysocephalum]|uniref:telomere repeats-binding bouquet formation protein 1 isoform X2 n=1 Tax=Neopelma chrysocephalum TaxID=114329 RepID=UPI000FCCEE78|nr:telomere repeats-binding bouquet formation protein 1 isoform X2 [Neopelma chrysocephalum]